MIFETLNESAERGELLLVDGGFCHWHLRRDGQLTIREIISTRPGAGSLMLNRLRWKPGVKSLFAKCPADLPANEWYSRVGFMLERIEVTKSGRGLHCWRLPVRWHWRPNAQHRELIYCADGNARFASIALDAGWLYGARLPGTVYYRPYMVDQDWRDPDRAAYMAALREHRPFMATVLDWEREEQLPEVLDWANEAAQYVQVVIIIPKVTGSVSKIPHSVRKTPIRLGYSVPTKFAGTTVPLVEFLGWPVHLLGGCPEQHRAITSALDVVSIDTSYHKKVAVERCQFYQPNTQAKRIAWPQLSEVGGWGHDAPYEAFRRSCVTIKRTWDAFEQPARAPKHQLALDFN